MKDSEPNTRPAGASKPAAPRNRRWIGVTALLAGLVLAGWLIFGLLSKHKAPARAPSGIPVSAETVRQGNLDLYIDALGTVTPVSTVTVTSRVGGELTEVCYQEGQRVKRNDLLAVIDPRPYDALLLQAQGQLARDQAQLKNARLDLDRYRSAYEQHAIPEQQLATQQALVDQDAGVVKLDEGNQDAAQINVDYTRIVSPIDGRVGLRAVDSGNIVVANGTTALATITQLQPITVIFNLAEDDLPRVTGPLSAGGTLRVDALDREQSKTLARGTLITLDNQINPATGTVRARATFPNLKNELFPSQFVNTRLYVSTLKQGNLVPTAAIQRNGDAAFVYVVQADSTVKPADVKIVAAEGETTAVTGVNPGDRLVTDGFDKLQGGVKVAVRSSNGDADSSAKNAAAAAKTE